jgi:gamma-glutamyltranspeptidase/glutathione hydrolase
MANNMKKEKIKLMKISLFFTMLLIAGCTKLAHQTGDNYQLPQQKVVRSLNGVVTTAHPLATTAGVKILEAGGNAMDAAVAAAFTLSVVEPSMSGIGGRAQIIIYTPTGGVHGIDATTQAPPFYKFKDTLAVEYGYETIAVPGVVKGLTDGLSEFGSLPLAKVMTPAISYANNGFTLLPGEAFRQESVNEVLKEFSGTWQYYLTKDSAAKKAGDLIIQSDLAKVLKSISEKGPDVFYRGWIAQAMVRDVRQNGGFLTLESLENYRAEKSHIVSGSYRGYGIKALWLPAYGAITIEALHILEQLPVNLNEEREWARAVYHAIKAAYLDKKEQKTLDDAKRFTSTSWAKKRAMETPLINGPESNGSNTGSKHSIPKIEKDLNGHTSHLTVVDKNGMVVSLTQTIGPTMGSKVATPGLGFLYAQTMGGYLGEVEPNLRVPSHISPVIVFKDDKPLLALGAAGGSRIPSSIVNVISRIIDYEMSLSEALYAPRVHPLEEGINLEVVDGTRWNEDDSTFFSQLGYMVEMRRLPGQFGRIHAVMLDTLTGEWIGCADPDWEGTAESASWK